MEATTDACNSIRIMNHSTLRVPYESLNKTFRIVQKQMDRDISAINKSADELVKAKTQQDISALLTGVIDKLSKLKRKAGSGVEDELGHLQASKRRLNYLMGGLPPSPQQQQQQQQQQDVSSGAATYWERRRLACLLVDYLLRRGLYSTARKLARLRDVEDLTNLPYFSDCQDVEASLLKGETVKALAWCSEHRSKLRKLASNFEFSLRLQEFVKLSQTGKRLEAVQYARKHLSPEADPEAPKELLPERNRSLAEAMGLLAVPNGRQVPDRYQHLVQGRVWPELVEKFRQVNCSVHSVSANTVFCACLQTGLAALKTNQCGKEGKRSPDCPVCQPYFSQLAESLPRAQYTQSRLICPISRLPMDHDNPPMALPNGNIYSQKSLAEMSRANNGWVTCPRTGAKFESKEAKRVYIM